MGRWGDGDPPLTPPRRGMGRWGSVGSVGSVGGVGSQISNGCVPPLIRGVRGDP
ncbi:MAG: hypothetical protein F6J98_00350 [Moorea sp. SIO4G2]|nr:hypothetical protein [Moorena sp. SIO4G2]